MPDLAAGLANRGHQNIANLEVEEEQTFCACVTSIAITPVLIKECTKRLAFRGEYAWAGRGLQPQRRICMSACRLLLDEAVVWIDACPCVGICRMWQEKPCDHDTGTGSLLLRTRITAHK